jgi:hypothetical protein
MQPSMRAMLLGDSNDVLDEQQRPVGEVRASAPVRGNCKAVYAMCPYAGSRHRATRLMNLSALDQLTGVWPQPLGVLAQVRRLHGLRPGTPPPLLDLCRVGFTTLCLPAHMAYRSAPRTIPARIAATHKMTQGLFGLCKNLLIDSVARGQDYRNTVVNVGELYRFAESSGILLSRTGIEACAAPPEMIGAALRLLALGACNDGAGDADAPPAAISHEDGEQLLAYSAAVADMTIWTTVAAIALRAVMERVIDSAADPGGCADYLLSGFSDPVVGLVLDLHDDIRHQYGLGAIALCSDGATASALRRVLERPVLAAASAPNPAPLWRDMALGIEDQLMRIFERLQRRVLAALGRPPLPPPTLAATVGDAFGHLPSHYLGGTGVAVQRGDPLPVDEHV